MEILGGIRMNLRAPPVPESVRKLVERFENEHNRIFDKSYKEANVRQDFLDPLFGALGWDTANSHEVQHERTVRFRGEVRSVDLAFKLNTQVKFMLEAKKPISKVQGNRDYAFQARSYGWNASVPFVILSDFEEFVVYDTSVRPKESDSADVAALPESWTYKQYVTQWDSLWSKFSKEAVLGGSLEELSRKVSGRHKRIRVDESLLEDIENWRIHLAKRIIAKNALEPHQLPDAVQLLLDRVLFLRICEDRGLEQPRRLAGLLEAGNVYERLKRYFQLADQKYNAGLFYLDEERGRGPPDSISPSLVIDDDALKEVVRGLYDKNKPYDFAVIPTEILGHVYEQFLGTVLRVTASGERLKPEFKPEVKEAGGVFYTPTYIVDSVVRATIGPLVEGRTPIEVSTLRIVDPACGSGSFLLGAYQFLLDWHLAWYLRDGARKHPRELVEISPGHRVLSVEERKRILRNNIYGVDIDRQATEVTKLSLFLKVVEETAGASLETNQKLFEKRVLPSLEGNIKCGNSLIEPSHVPQQSFDSDSLQTARRVNAFSWKQAFAPIMAKGGFDAVIGNPPYIRVQALNKFAPLEVELYKKHYESASKGNYDIYVAFVERGLQLLNKNGRLGYILPHKFFNAQYGKPLRELISRGRHLDLIVHFGDQQVFEQAITYTCLLFLRKEGTGGFRFQRVPTISGWRDEGRYEETVLSAGRATSEEWNFVINARSGSIEASKFRPLVDVVPKIFQGIATSADAVYAMPVVEKKSSTIIVRSRALDGEPVELESEILHPLLKGSEIQRYAEPENQLVVLFPYRIVGNEAVPFAEIELRERFPLAHAYLLRNKTELLTRSKTDLSNWWYFPYPKNLALYNKPKILVQVLSRRGNFTWDPGNFYFLGGGTAGGNALLVEDKTQAMYLLSILNSPVTTRHVSGIASAFKGGFFAFGKGSLASLPVRTIDFSDPSEREMHDQLVQLAERMLRLHKDKAQINFDADRELVKRQIDSTDEEINEILSKLYGLEVGALAAPAETQ